MYSIVGKIYSNEYTENLRGLGRDLNNLKINKETGMWILGCNAFLTISESNISTIIAVGLSIRLPHGGVW